MIYNQERPHDFDGVVGQEMVVENIRNQSIKDSFFPVFILCGQYGSGKTTMASIIAMAANCKHKDERGNPCGKCDSCKAVLEHSPEGIIEIDGASNNGVDNIRKLLSQASTLGIFKKKVFVIDEAHMLSKSAFNALLITLENPPAHCIFILCTTEKDALPETVISRAPVYVFGKISDMLIKEHILNVADKHGISITFDAAGLLSRYVNGAMRNALQLLEHLSLQKNDGETITADDIVSVLGLSSMEQRADFLEGCLAGNIRTVIEVLRNCELGGISVKTFLQDVLKMNTDIILCSTGADIVGTSFYLERVKELSAYPADSVIKVSRMLSVISAVSANLLSVERIIADIASVMCEAAERTVYVNPVLPKGRTEQKTQPVKPLGTTETAQIKADDKPAEESVPERKITENREVLEPESVQKADGFSDIPEDTEIPFEKSHVAEKDGEDAEKELSVSADEQMPFGNFGGGLFGGGLFGGGVGVSETEKKGKSKKEETDSVFLGFASPVKDTVADGGDIHPSENVEACEEKQGGFSGFAEHVTAEIPEERSLIAGETVGEKSLNVECTEGRRNGFADSFPPEISGRISWDEAAKLGLVPDKSELALPVPETEKELEEIYKKTTMKEAPVEEVREDEEEVEEKKTEGMAKEELARLLKNPGFRIIYNKARTVECNGYITLFFTSLAHVTAAKAFLKTSEYIRVEKE